MPISLIHFLTSQMLHLGCMDYSKLTFPMPMTGGGILQGHIFARVAHGMYDQNNAGSNSGSGSKATRSGSGSIMLHNTSDFSVFATPNGSDGVVSSGLKSGEQKVSSASTTISAYDYDYIAEWVNHRSDEVGLQLDFIDSITEIVDQLRTVDRPLRTDTFRAEMLELEQSLSSHSDWFGFEPCGAATEPRYKIEHFVLSDCRVFRTKARAPSLLSCVVRRDDAELEWSLPALQGQRHGSIDGSAGSHTDWDNKNNISNSSIEQKVGRTESIDDTRQSLGQCN